MAVDLVETAGATDANSFSSVDDANTYLNARLNASAWTGAVNDDKARALIEATRELNYLDWSGARTADTQALSWPRDYVLDPDGLTSADYLDSTTIPTRVRDATCELALEFLRAGTTDITKPDTSLGVVREKVDVLETEYVSPYDRLQGLARYPRVLTLITPLLDASGAGGLDIVRV